MSWKPPPPRLARSWLQIDHAEDHQEQQGDYCRYRQRREAAELVREEDEHRDGLPGWSVSTPPAAICRWALEGSPPDQTPRRELRDASPGHMVARHPFAGGLNPVSEFDPGPPARFAQLFDRVPASGTGARCSPRLWTTRRGHRARVMPPCRQGRQSEVVRVRLSVDRRNLLRRSSRMGGAPAQFTRPAPQHVWLAGARGRSGRRPRPSGNVRAW